MKRGERFVRWFAAMGGSVRAFYLVFWFCLVYQLVGQRVPHLPHLPWFDPYPSVFLMIQLTIFGVLQNVALQFLATESVRQNEALLSYMQQMLQTIEGEEQGELTLLTDIHAKVSHHDAPSE